MSLLHIGGTEYEEGYTGIRKDTNSQPSVQRHRIPHAVFRERDLLSLYNAVTGNAYQNADDLKIVTLENAIYMG